jgi:hypothetical protein
MIRLPILKGELAFLEKHPSQRADQIFYAPQHESSPLPAGCTILLSERIYTIIHIDILVNCEIPKCLPSAIAFNFAVDVHPSSFPCSWLECFQTAIDLTVPGYLA